MQKCCHSTVHSYLPAVCYLRIVKGVKVYSDSLRQKLCLEQVSKGLKRIKPAAQDSRLSITPAILSRIHSVLSGRPSNPVNVTIFAPCCLGYFTHLCLGEFTLPSGSWFDPVKHLSPADIVVDSHANLSLLRVHLKYAILHQQDEGVDLFIGQSYNNLCLFFTVLTYIV